MKRSLLILGAGAHGAVVAEVAREMAIYGKIHFLDDERKSSEVVGSLMDYQALSEQYSEAFVAFGNPVRRKMWHEKLCCYYQIPVLIHPRAWLSESACVEAGSVIEAMACINSHSVIRQGVIVGLGVLVDHDVEVGAFSHLDCGAVISPGQQVPGSTKISAGAVFPSEYHKIKW